MRDGTPHPLDDADRSLEQKISKKWLEDKGGHKECYQHDLEVTLVDHLTINKT